ncbi:MBL fold metallo-hydrolase [Streptomyces sp. R-74717]
MISRLNRGYAVRSIEAIPTSPDTSPNRARHARPRAYRSDRADRGQAESGTPGQDQPAGGKAATAPRSSHCPFWAHLGWTPSPGTRPGSAPTGSRVDREPADGDEIRFGSGARVVHAPGHTPGSIGIHLPHHEVLFTGGCVAGVGQVMLGVFTIDRAQAVASFRRLAALEPATACFGHGDPLTVDAAAVLRASADRDSGLQVEHG